ncbi:MAG: hypothetical protein ACE5Q6_23850 [Dehalococcoidia bacterium]
MLKYLGIPMVFLTVLMLMAAPAPSSPDAVAFVEASFASDSFRAAAGEQLATPRANVPDSPADPSSNSAQMEEEAVSATWISLLVSAMLGMLIMVFIGSWYTRNRR